MFWYTQLQSVGEERKFPLIEDSFYNEFLTSEGAI
jgi:hypothetical protein